MPESIRKRTFRFALRILDVVDALPRDEAGTVVRNQLAACGTSVGANVEEADNARTKADTRKHFAISRKEAAESLYFLRIVQHRWRNRVNVEADMREADEIVRILNAIVGKLS